MNNPEIIRHADNLLATAGIHFLAGNVVGATGDEIFTAIPGVEEMGDISPSVEDKDITPYDATSKQYVPGPVTESGTLEIGYRLYKGNAMQAQVEADFKNRVTRNYRQEITPTATDAAQRLAGSDDKTIAIASDGTVTLVGLDFTAAGVLVGDAIIIGETRYIISEVTGATEAQVSNPPARAVTATKDFTVEERRIVFSFAAFVNNLPAPTERDDYRMRKATLKITGPIEVQYV